jgi:hypothetical protein
VNDIGILTAVMDGKGYISQSGSHGRRGYEGEYRFNMIAATTPPEHRVWQALGKLSSRWIFYRLEPASNSFKDLREDFIEKKRTCQTVVQGFNRDFWKGFGSVSWDRTKDAEVWGTLLNWSAIAMCQWRGLIPRQDFIGYNPPLIEAPDRLRETLYALARGHALLWGREQIDWNDVNFVIYVNQTNMPEDRLRVFRALDYAYTKYVRDGGDPEKLFDIGISLSEAARAIGCSEDKAERVLRELVDLGVVRQNMSQRYCRAV